MRKTTISDVARAAGVSIKTVSRVLNMEPNVHAETIKRVQTAAQELHYRPNLSARALAGRRSFMIGLIYDHPSAHYAIDLHIGALTRAREESYRLLVHPCNADGAEVVRDIASLVLDSRLDGVVVAPPLCDDPDVMDELRARTVHCVQICPTVRDMPEPCVFIDDEAAAYAMTEHLLHLGHSRIGFIEGPPLSGVSARRRRGFTEAMAAHGQTLLPSLLDSGSFSFDSGRAAGGRLLDGPIRPTALFACNDDMAAGALMAARERNLHAPADISVVGFEDSLVSRAVWPQLTTLHQPTYELAYHATDLLFRLIKGQSCTPQLQLDCALIQRHSTGPAPQDES